MIGAQDTIKLEKYGTARAFREAVVRISGPKMDQRFALLDVMEMVRKRVGMQQHVLPTVASDEFNEMMKSGHLVKGEGIADSAEERFWYTFNPHGRPRIPA